MIAYLESSAAAKLLFDEAESDSLGAYLRGLKEKGGRVVSSSLLETELRRAAVREDAPQTRVSSVLDRIDVFDLPRSTFISAGILPSETLRSLDAIHIAAALLLNADVMVSYDKRQIEAAQAAGLRTHSPA